VSGETNLGRYQRLHTISDIVEPPPGSGYETGRYRQLQSQVLQSGDIERSLSSLPLLLELCSTASQKRFCPFVRRSEHVISVNCGLGNQFRIQKTTIANLELRCAATVFIACCVAVLIGCGTQIQTVIVPPAAILAPGQQIQFRATTTGGASRPQVWEVNGIVGGSSATGTITSYGLFTAPSTIPAQPIRVSLQDLPTQSTVTFFDPSNFSPGSVAATQNPLVATYSLSVPAAASIRVQFGTNTGYAFSTSPVAGPPAGGAVTVLVAGMRAKTSYHMQAILSLADGSHLTDTDHIFTTGSIPASRLPNITAQQTGTSMPNDGVELLSLVPSDGGSQFSAVATDLSGNVIWYYDLGSGEWPFPIKLIGNGHMLLVATPTANFAGQEIREIDLAGNVISRITLDQVNPSLTGTPYQVSAFHHDVLPLPNGHIVLLGQHSETNLPGVADGTTVIGDILIDWDPASQRAVWVWSAFDHLDPSRAPYGIQDGTQDWTHANAVIYSPDDGNLILSLRNQNWILKLNYRNGTGDGGILWHLGFEGDFSLPGQQAPIEWNYGQHYPTILSPNSSGVFSMMFFNNGNGRLMNTQNIACGSLGVGNCYSSVPIFQLDESNKTATVLSEDILSPTYSICCGDALLLPNGDLEFDIAADLGTPNVSHIEEVTQTTSPELVWRMDIEGQLAYRGFRIPSLYPGQTWPATVQAGTSITRSKQQSLQPAIPRLRFP
jgi:arylsulfate sulfotransferase